MAQKKKFDIPELPRGILPLGAENFLREMREAVQKLIGTRGDGTDAAVSWDALMRAGFAERPGSVIDVGSIPGAGAGGGSSYEPDLTKPPTPTGLTVTPGTAQIIVQWDAPTYTAGRGHGQTEIYAVKRDASSSDPAPVFGDATLVDVATGAITVYSLPSELETRWYVWIKWRSLDGVASDQAGGTNGVTAVTSQDVTKLLEALGEKLTVAQLASSLSSSIALITAPDTTAGSVNARIKAEADSRVAALLAEATNRTNAIDAKAAELTDDFEGADAALSSSLTSAFTAADAATLSSAQGFTYARSVIDSSIAATLSTLRAEFAAADVTTLASAQAYTYSRATIDSSISTSTATLRSQLTGGYTGTDLDALTSGLLYVERTTRTTQINGLSQQIALLSAGAGEQFDYSDIWYFDSGTESWAANNGTNVALTAEAGWLVLKATTGTQTDRNPMSPDNLDVDGAKYPQVRARIRKYGSPTWEGGLWWTTTADNTYTAGKSVTIAEPSYDADGIAVVTWNAPATWTGATIRRIVLNLSTSVSTTDYYTVDWVAVGRPSPGASSAQLTDEQTARAAADSAEVTARQALSAKLTGVNDPASLTLSTLSSGLLFEERQARASADTAQAGRLDSLEATVNNATTGVTATASALDAVELLVNDGVKGNNALATRASNIEASIKNPTSALVTWNFSGTTDGWTGYAGGTVYGSIAAGTNAAQLTASLISGQGYQMIVQRDLAVSERFQGSRVHSIAARVKKPTAGAAWHGRLYYQNALHFFDGAFFVQAPQPVWGADDWGVAEWVIATGSVADWNTGDIYSIRLDIHRNGANPTTSELDWVSVLTQQPAASSATVQSLAQAVANGDAAQAFTSSAIQATIDGMAAAGANRVKNSSFEVDSNSDGLADGIQIYNSGGVSATPALVPGNGGGLAQQITFGSGAGTMGIIITGAATQPWEPNKTYIIAFDAKGSGSHVGPATSMALGWNTSPASQTPLSNPAISTSWQRYAFRVTMGSSVEANGTAHVTSQGGTRSGPLVFDNLMIYEGARLVPYSPGLDGGGGTTAAVASEATARASADTANANAINTVNARLNSGGDTYASIVSASSTATTALNNAATADGKAVAAQNTANTASTNASNALAALAEIASDNILTPGEKPEAIQKRDVIVAEQTGIGAQATAYGITTEKTAYDNAVTALTNYLATLTSPVLWSNLGGNTTIVGATFRSKFADVYTTRQALLNKIAANAKALADAAQNQANTATSNAATAQGTANTALGNAAAAQSAADTANNKVNEIAADDKFTAVEKQDRRAEWDIIAAEKAGIEASATTFGITTEKTTYTNAFQALANYLNNGTAWSNGIPSWISDANLSTTTTIVGATFRATWKAYYDARTALLNKVAANAKALADAAQSTANSANDLATTTAGQVTTLQSQMTGATGSNLLSQIQTEATTRASQTGTLFAQYTVKTAVGGLVSGYGLASEANNAAPTSAFGIQAGSFFVAPPAVESPTAPTTNLFPGYVWRDTSTNTTRYRTAAGGWSTTPQVYPFSIQTTPTTLNGVAVQPGMYVDAAFIRDGSITNAKIGNATIDDAKVANLSVSKLTAGALSFGSEIRSTTYVGGSAGTILRHDGFFEASNAVIRGTIYATAGAIGGSYIGSNYMQATTWVSGTTGWRLNSDGTGWIGGIYAAGSALQSSNFSAGSAGFQFKNDGTFEANNATLRGGLDVTSTGYVRGGQTAYNTGIGFHFGYSGGVYKVSVGNPSGNYLTYDGTNMVLKGKFTADAIDAVDALNIKARAVIATVGGETSAQNVYGGSESGITLLTLPPITVKTGGVASLMITHSYTSAQQYMYQLRLQVTRNNTLISSLQIDGPISKDGDNNSIWLPFIRTIAVYDTPSADVETIYRVRLVAVPGQSWGGNGGLQIEALKVSCVVIGAVRN